MTDLIKFRRGTAAEWTAADPVLAAGEPGAELDTHKVKVGDGVTAWTGLAYVGAGGGALTAEDVRDIIAATLTEGAGITLTEDDAGDTLEIASSGGVGGGLAAAYLGKNAIGASWFTGATYTIYKRVTAGAGGAMLLGIEAHIRPAADVFAGLGVSLLSDVAGAPGKVLGQSSGGYQLLLDSTGSDVGASGVGRWIAFPLAYQLAPSASYWVGIVSGDYNRWDLAYDTGGSDRTYQGGAASIDWGTRYTATTTTRDHSIRANVLT